MKPDLGCREMLKEPGDEAGYFEDISYLSYMRYDFEGHRLRIL